MWYAPEHGIFNGNRSIYVDLNYEINTFSYVSSSSYDPSELDLLWSISCITYCGDNSYRYCKKCKNIYGKQIFYA